MTITSSMDVPLGDSSREWRLRVVRASLRSGESQRTVQVRLAVDDGYRRADGGHGFSVNALAAPAAVLNAARDVTVSATRLSTICPTLEIIPLFNSADN